jgi:hypothetical protein
MTFLPIGVKSKASDTEASGSWTLECWLPITELRQLSWPVVVK